MTDHGLGLTTTELVEVAEPESRRMTLTAPVALDWLQRNKKNRALQDYYVDTLAGAMLRGEWKLNGDAIRFSTEYLVLDGQHRLWALVKAAEVNPDVSIDTFVVFGLEPGSQDTMDGGRKRTLSDVLKMHGEVSTMQLAATLNRIHLWRLGEGALRFAGPNRLTAAQGLSMLEREPHIRTAVRIAARIRGQLQNSVSASLLAPCLYRFDEIDHADSIEFWRQVGLGEGLKRYDPAYELRQAFFKNANRRSKLPTLVMHALIIKAWNAFRAGKPVQVLAWKAGGASPERFPEPV